MMKKDEKAIGDPEKIKDPEPNVITPEKLEKTKKLKKGEVAGEISAEKEIEQYTKHLKGAKGTVEGTEVAEVAGPSELVEQVISINRITKVTKGGKKLSFSALVVVGDTKGNVGYSLEKAAEVSIAIRKAMARAKKTMIAVPMRGSTIPHEIIGECGAARVLLKPASEGTGVIAAGPVRAVCDGAGIHNILTKCHRSNNPINVVKATFNGLSRLKSVN